MKKMLFLVCSVLFISTLSSCGGGAGKAAKAAAGASVLIREASENVNFKGTPASKAKCPNGSGKTYKRKGPGTLECVNCKQSWYSHSPSNGTAPENWD